MSIQLIQRLVAFGAFFLIINIICHKLLYGSLTFKDVYVYYRKSIKNNERLQTFRNEQSKAYYISGFSQPSPQICANFGVDFKVLVIVRSPPNHNKVRNRIRKTWGRKRNAFAIGFIMGQTDNKYHNLSVITESNSSSDIIVTKFKDDFENQTLVSIAMMQWVTEYCPKVKFLLRVDDHVYINVPRLFHFLNHTDEQENAIYGELLQLVEPERKRGRKFYILHEEYGRNFYPDYILGVSYVMPAYLAPLFYNASLDKQFLKVEDVFMTGLVAQSLFTRRVHAPAFSNLQRFGRAGPCSVYWIIARDIKRFFRDLSICDRLWNI